MNFQIINRAASSLRALQVINSMAMCHYVIVSSRKRNYVPLIVVIGRLAFVDVEVDDELRLIGVIGRWCCKLRRWRLSRRRRSVRNGREQMIVRMRLKQRMVLLFSQLLLIERCWTIDWQWTGILESAAVQIVAVVVVIVVIVVVVIRRRLLLVLLRLLSERRGRWEDNCGC